ncbi:MAG: hypothetical protein KDD44_14125, partial [Bdellovibrionales bacterium]|nr:hypothetical protein [Bdellovibrionales bacterium]
MEFLVADDGEIYFIEINPRIQVEHTVTEEITGLDLVACQLRIAAGWSLADLGIAAGAVKPSGMAIQCRITTEDPENGFMPDYGKIVAYRSAAGFGVRLDAGSAFAGGSVTPFYDSMLVKVTARGRSMLEATNRLRRALSEFRIRGVKTNIAFLLKLLAHPEFQQGEGRTTFLEDNPDVLVLPRRRDRANRLLSFIADVTVNGHEQMAALQRPSELPAVRLPVLSDETARTAPPSGWRTKLQSMGKEAFLQAVRDEKRLLITDTTFRDAHQSLLATRVRTDDMLRIAGVLARSAPELFSLEMWGGATFDTSMRFLKECPWERLTRMREKCPNILFQMLLRASSAVGYANYPDNLVQEFVKESAEAGIDVFRVFDALNWT